MLLKVLQFVEGLVELAGEMRLVAGNLLQGLIVGQDALPAQNVISPSVRSAFAVAL